MKINHNLSAVVANNKLHQNEDVVASSMERLSSGIRINHSKDDPSGMAISDRMTTQIDGLNQASQNASDASSLIETADGALNEITEIIQRMRELAVQAANDTNADTDVEAIQQEINELKKEIDRMSKDTEYNTKGLLDGTLNNRVYTSKNTTETLSDGSTLYLPDAERIETSDYVPAGMYRMMVNSGTRAVAQGGDMTALTNNSLQKVGEAAAGAITVNGYKIEINADDTYGEALQKFQAGAEKGEMTLDFSSGKTVLTSTEYGSTAKADIRVSNQNLASLFGLSSVSVTAGTDAKVSVLSGDIPTYGGGTISSAFDTTATIATQGNRVTIQQPGGFTMSFLLADSLEPNTGTRTTENPVTSWTSGGSSSSGGSTISGDGTSGTVIGRGSLITTDTPINTSTTDGKMISLEVTSLGTLQVQIGANENQTTNLRIPKLDLDNLYLDKVDVTTVNGADRAIGSLDWALQKVSEVRARVGAYENRLDHAVKSLDQSEENLTSAFSRIADVDMAEEMTKYTQYNVLVQASTSVLAQANDQPESVLQLLQ